jgi:DNA-binding MarR family transcriptional regulator
MTRLIAYIAENPGQTCEQIAEALKVKASIMSVRLREARAAGTIKSKGNTRGTRWRIA